ncbi:MAG TPA: glycosyltransferase family 39 protein, partial [Dehalococcoidia bacterium]|nr:glycosyltransferase family 39 protein [Dehalococcoidia bacterium]
MVALCVLALAGGALVATYVFDRLPHVEDEVAFLFQARTLASGQIVAKAPVLPEFFAMPFIMALDGQWFGKYPPGYPAVLALGALAGQPWLINPLFGALSVGLVYVAGRRFFGSPTGLLAAALTVASPFFLLQAGSALSHVVTLFWSLAFMLLFDAARRKSSEPAAWAAGGALGMLILSRPLTAVGIAIPFVLWAGMDILVAPRHVKRYLPMVPGALLFLAGLLAYNHLTTGDSFRTAYQLYWPYDRIGFGEGLGSLGEHTLEEGLLITSLNVEALADYLFGWPGRLSLIPAVLAAAFALARLAWRGVHRWMRPNVLGWAISLAGQAETGQPQETGRRPETGHRPVSTEGGEGGAPIRRDAPVGRLPWGAGETEPLETSHGGETGHRPVSPEG